MKTPPSKIKPLTRQIETRERKFDRESRTLEFSFSSEEPVDRWFGREVLVHEKGAARLGRLNDGAPLLFNHNLDDVGGVVEKAWMGEDSRGYTRVRFAKTARGEELMALVDDDILRNVSFMYRVHEWEVNSDDEELYRVVDWEPLEVSIVTVPADQTVGIGRSFANDENTVKVKPAHAANSRSISMADPTADEIAARDAKAQADAAREKLGKDFAKEQEAKRCIAIRQIAGTNGIGEDQIQNWIKTGADWTQIGDDIVAIHAQRAAQAPRATSLLGLGAQETREYSLARAILACNEGNWDSAGFELECHKEIAKRLGRQMRKNQFFVPFEVQKRPTQVNVGQLAQRVHALGGNPSFTRDLNVATTTQGGFLVQTSIQSFDELLRNISFAFRMGVTRLSGLRDPITIPRQSAAATAVWLASETATITESTQAFVQLAMSPKSVGAYTEISDLLLKQSSIDVEGFVTADLAAVAALAVDVAVLSGSGASGQPTGLDNTAGIGSVSGTSLAAAGVIEFQTDIAAGNVMPLRGGYVTTPAVAGLLMVRPELPSTGTERLWKGNIWNGSLFDFPALTTNQVATAVMYFGDWSKIIIGEWGTLEITTNPYANFQAGIIGVRALYSVDVGVRYPVAFSRATTIT